MVRRIGIGSPALLLLFFATLSVHAQLRCAEPVANLGVIRGGPSLEHEFTFEAGKVALEIIEVKRGCNCLTPRLNKRHLKPGDTSRLRLEIRTLGQPDGPHAWSAQVRYREGDVIRELTVSIKAVVKNEVVVQPAALALHVETGLKQVITITDARDAPFAVKHLHCTAPAKVSFEKLAAGKHKVIIEVQAGDLTAARTDGVLNIYTDDPFYAHLQVPVTLTTAARSPILVNPEDVQLRLTNGQMVDAALVRLRPRGKDAITIKNVTCGAGVEKCDWAHGPDGGATLKVRVDGSKLTESVVKTSVRVELSEPAGAVITIPVTITRE